MREAAAPSIPRRESPGLRLSVPAERFVTKPLGDGNASSLSEIKAPEE
jgi:hypothetical protein